MVKIFSKANYENDHSDSLRRGVPKALQHYLPVQYVTEFYAYLPLTQKLQLTYIFIWRSVFYDQIFPKRIVE